MYQNSYSRIYLFGFSLWKLWFIKLGPFFGNNIIFIHTFFGQKPLQKALDKNLDSTCAVYIWGKQNFSDLEDYASSNQIPIFRVEDGFIRSIGLGSDLTQPYSLVIDSKGIYFDPSQPSDLEHLLQNHQFREEEINRAQIIRQYLVDKKISKYNLYDSVDLEFPHHKTIIIVPGQVDDDASIRCGAPGMNNLELLKQVRKNRPNAYIVFKPHPDVLVGNRSGHVEKEVALQYCDQIVTTVGIDSVLAHADEVHTMTSLVGFEAIMRNKKVVTYGVPFYAGWGLSEDLQSCTRRTRKLTIDELVAGVYLLYPQYIDPETLEPCGIETVLNYLDKRQGQYRTSIFLKMRNWFSRKSQMMLRVIKNYMIGFK